MTNGSANDRIHVLGTAGADVVPIAGTAGADNVTATLEGTDVAVTGATPGVHVTLTAVEQLNLGLGAGDDTFAAAGNLAPLVLDVGGGADDDTLTGSGSSGGDILDGGPGADTIDGRQGNDVLFGGDGADVIRWDPGDGSDVVEGGPGADRLVFNGSNVNELIDVSANGGRVRLFRNVANVTMDVNDVETFDVTTIGGADGVTVNDLTGTDLATLNVGLGALGGGDDAQADQVIVNGTAGDDTIAVSAIGSTVDVAGLHTKVDITGSAASNDRLTVNGLAGRNQITATPGVAALIQANLVP